MVSVILSDALDFDGHLFFFAYEFFKLARRGKPVFAQVFPKLFFRKIQFGLCSRNHIALLEGAVCELVPDSLQHIDVLSLAGQLEIGDCFGIASTGVSMRKDVKPNPIGNQLQVVFLERRLRFTVVCSEIFHTLGA